MRAGLCECGSGLNRNRGLRLCLCIKWQICHRLRWRVRDQHVRAAYPGQLPCQERSRQQITTRGLAVEWRVRLHSCPGAVREGGLRGRQQPGLLGESAQSWQTLRAVYSMT